MKLNILAAVTLLAVSISSFAQEKMTLSQAIHTARSQSVEALETVIHFDILGIQVISGKSSAVDLHVRKPDEL